MLVYLYFSKQIIITKFTLQKQNVYMYMKIQSISIWRQKDVKEREGERDWGGGGGGGMGGFKNLNQVCTVK